MFDQDPDRNVGFLLHDVSRRLRMRFDRRAQDMGLTRAQWRVLVHLAPRQGLNQAALAAGGGGLSGGLRQQARDVGAAAAEAGAQASAQQDALSAQLAAQRGKEVKAALERQYERARQNRQRAMKTVGTIAQLGVNTALNPTAVAQLQKFMPFTTSAEKT